MAQINRKILMEAVLKGLDKAQTNYLKWTKNQDGISNSAEYILTTYVAEQIANVYSDYIFIEENIKNFVEDDLSKNEEYKKIRADGRTDIALYNDLEDRKLKTIIELKNNVDRVGKGLKEDIERIDGLIKLDKIEYGLIAFITEHERKKEFDIAEIEGKIKDIVLECKKKVPNLQYRYVYKVIEPEKSDVNTTWGWGSCVILFSKKVKK